jgi:hypothetical protein
MEEVSSVKIRLLVFSPTSRRAQMIWGPNQRSILPLLLPHYSSHTLPLHVQQEIFLRRSVGTVVKAHYYVLLFF